MADLDSFNSRINRINRGRQWAPEGVVHQPAPSPRANAAGNAVARLFHAISLPMAFSIGAFAMVVARFARLKVSGLPANGNVLTDTLMTDAVMALVVGFVLLQIVSMRGITQLFTAISGLGATALTMHMFVHRAPDVFAQFFGAAWVDAVISQTMADAVLFAHLIDRLPV